MQYSTGLGLGKESNKYYFLWEYDSIKELADAAQATPAQYRFSSERADDERTDWVTTKDVDDAHHLAVDGWHGIRAEVDAHLTPLRERLGEVLSVERVRTYDMIGSEPDIDRYLDGEMECMWNDIYVEEPHNGKVFTMMVDSTITWRNSAADVLKRGAVLCALVEAFTMLGYQLELYGEWTMKGSNHDKYATILTRLNNAGEPLDIDSVMFAIGNPDWYRRIAFAFGEGHEELRKNFGFCDKGYYGLLMNGCHMYDRVGASSIVSIDNNQPMVDDPVRWILDQLEEQGVIDGDDYI